MHAVEDGVVGGAQPELEPVPAVEGPRVDAAHRIDECGVVDRLDLAIDRSARRLLSHVSQIEERRGLDVLVGDENALGPERMIGAEIVQARRVFPCHESNRPRTTLHIGAYHCSSTRRREASGFCIYNDPAVGIAKALEMQPDWRVMYVDIDVHHGDGVQWIFYEEPRVLTVSLHQSGRYLYPGTGSEKELGEGPAKGTAANVPLLPFTGNTDYVWAAEALIPALAEAFRPHLLVTQLGADTHHGDPLANLGLTMAAYPCLARLLHDTAHSFAEGRWVATGGGGYQATTVVPKVWTIHFAEMCGAPDRVPPEWLDDRPPDEVSREDRSEVERSVNEVLDACLRVLSALARGGP